MRTEETPAADVVIDTGKRRATEVAALHWRVLEKALTACVWFQCSILPTRLRNAPTAWMRMARRSPWLRSLWSRIPEPIRRRFHERRFLLRFQVLLPAMERRLADILRRHPDCALRLVFVPGVEWNLTLFQRPHHLARFLARQGLLVFFVEPLQADSEPGFHEIEDRLFVVRAPREILASLVNATFVVQAWSVGQLERLAPREIVYDYIDHLSVFPGDPCVLRQTHEALLRRARLVLATSRALYNEVAAVRPDVVLCPNGVDLDHFERTPAVLDPPADLREILDHRKPLIGYYGALARWFDFELLESVAQARSNLSFVLIGPDYDGSLHRSRLLKCRNVHWLGARAYVDLPRYLHHFDATMIPFRLDDVTHATSPLKLFEYMAAGKPVVCTPMRECLLYDGVLSAADSQEFSRQLDVALSLRSDRDYQQRIERVARENSWAARAHQIAAALRDRR